jgi:hypothetical protein
MHVFIRDWLWSNNVLLKGRGGNILIGLRICPARADDTGAARDAPRARQCATCEELERVGAVRRENGWLRPA